MKSFISLISISILALLASCGSMPPKQQTMAQAIMHGRTLASSNVNDLDKPKRRIVVLKSNAGDPGAISKSVARRFRGVRGHVYNHALKGFAISLSDNAVSKLKTDKRVRYITNDKPVKAYTQTVPPGITRIGADRNATAAIAGDGGNVDVDIAILDTGADLTHPDLNIYRSVNFAKGKSAKDGHGHGTHVAGTSAARDDGNGVVGVAPGARLWIIRVLDNRGNGWTSDIIEGIDYVTLHSNEIDVANMSLGGAGSDDGNCGLTNNDPEHEAICNAVANGVVFVVAAGNDDEDSKTHAPAAYDEVITVSAMVDTDGAPGGNGPDGSYGPDDTLATFSNFGADVDIAGPGVDIYSTYKGGVYATMSGTSMASPHIAGVAALYIAKNGKPSDGAGVNAIKLALIADGFPQSSSDGFTGDSDGFEEPLSNAEVIDPMGPPAAAVKLTVNSDQSNYDLFNGETTAVVSTTVKDENGDFIQALTSTAFAYQIDGSSSAQTTTEVSAGVYNTSLNINGYSDGNHTVNVTVTDTRPLSGGGSTSFTTQTTASTTPVIHVDSITYGTSGGKNRDKNLLITIRVVDQNSSPVDGAAVSISLYNGGSFEGSGTAATDGTGSVTFQLRNAGTGCYTTDVTNVSKSGADYDSTANEADAGFCK